MFSKCLKMEKMRPRDQRADDAEGANKLKDDIKLFESHGLDRIGAFRNSRQGADSDTRGAHGRTGRVELLRDRGRLASQSSALQLRMRLRAQQLCADVRAGQRSSVGCGRHGRLYIS